MSFLKDLGSLSIAPAPWREIRVGIVVVAAVVAVTLWRVDSLALQILIPVAVAALYLARAFLSASQHRRRRSDIRGSR